MSAPHLALGTLGERIAEAYLLARGCEVLERNYRFSRAEVDLIVRDGGDLVFVEVKTRRSGDADAAAAQVGYRKQRNVMNAAGRYLADADYRGDIRFDIVAVIVSRGGGRQVTWRRDAFGFFN